MARGIETMKDFWIFIPSPETFLRIPFVFVPHLESGLCPSNVGVSFETFYLLLNYWGIYLFIVGSEE
jgi:hypothetical protein